MQVIILKDRQKREYECLVDDADYDRLKNFKWGLHKQKNSEHCYARRYIDGKWIFMHNEIMQHEKGLYVDHTNRDGLDNRRQNLRVVTQSLNILNSKPYNKMSDLPRGVTRVFYKGELKGYKTQIRFKGKGYHLGFFKDVTLAYLAYLKKARELGIYNYNFQGVL